MKFLVLFLSTTAFASSFTSKFAHVDDNAIVIDGENGRRVIISKEIGPYGQHVMEIEINGPNNFSKKLQINDEIQDNHQDVPQNYRMSPRNVDEVDVQRTKRSKVSGSSQMDILSEIMKEYQGVTDLASYEKLLSKVNKAVQKGKIDSTVLNYLQFLTQKQSLAHPDESEVQYLNQPQENQQWNLQPENWQGYPRTEQNWQRGMLLNKQQPLMNGYEQKWMPERYMWQDVNWNKKLPINYAQWKPVKEMTYQNLPWMQQSMNHYMNQNYPSSWFSQDSDEKKWKYSPARSYDQGYWMGADNWMNSRSWKNGNTLKLGNSQKYPLHMEW